MSILFLLVTVLPVTLTVFIIISFFCFCINCSPEPHADSVNWICPYISRHLLSLNPLLACCRRYSRGER